MGEIVEVEGGGHIVRSKGRKDRHSKVCTAKGPRDRRVRLSAHTAIQFYDVQDRLGYDRPSKALDWLINKAKSAIDQLAQLPPWKPTQLLQQNDDVSAKANPNSNQNDTDGLGLGFGFLQSENEIADTVKSFLPVTTSFSPIQFHHHHHQHVLFTDAMVAWNGAAIDTGNNDALGGGFVFNAPSPSPLISPQLPSVLFGQNQYLSSQRGPLQSSNNNPTVRAFIDAPSFLAADHRIFPAAMVHQPYSSPVTGFASGGFSGFRVPARIQGDEEEYGGVSDKPSSASSDSRR